MRTDQQTTHYKDAVYGYKLFTIFAAAAALFLAPGIHCATGPTPYGGFGWGLIVLGGAVALLALAVLATAIKCHTHSRPAKGSLSDPAFTRAQLTLEEEFGGWALHNKRKRHNEQHEAWDEEFNPRPDPAYLAERQPTATETFRDLADPNPFARESINRNGDVHILRSFGASAEWYEENTWKEHRDTI